MGDDYFSIRNLTVIVDASRDATAQFNSVVNTSGRTVKWVSGSKFACLVNGPGTATVRINGSNYTVSGTPTDTSITVTSELPQSHKRDSVVSRNIREPKALGPAAFRVFK